MTPAFRHLIAASLMLTLTGCAETPPLMFGDDLSFGLRLGNQTSSAGASVSIGYKQRSIAIVPVSQLDKAGKATRVVSRSNGEVDTLSVFAVFDGAAADPSGTSPGDARVSLGQVFSTGVAAQVLSQGYQRCRFGTDKDCEVSAAMAAASAAADARVAAATASQATADLRQALQDGNLRMAGAPDDTPVIPITSRPYQPPLVYTRTDVLGIDIGGTVAEQGAQFVLGFSSRNVALIPVIAKDGNGRVNNLLVGKGDASDEDRQQDAYSVLGQFGTRTSTTGLNFGLQRYFATGMAARNLGDGLAREIARARSAANEANGKHPPAPVASAPAVATR